MSVVIYNSQLAPSLANRASLVHNISLLPVSTLIIDQRIFHSQQSVTVLLLVIENWKLNLPCEQKKIAQLIIVKNNDYCWLSLAVIFVQLLHRERYMTNKIIQLLLTIMYMYTYHSYILQKHLQVMIETRATFSTLQHIQIKRHNSSYFLSVISINCIIAYRLYGRQT